MPKLIARIFGNQLFTCVSFGYSTNELTFVKKSAEI